MLKKYRNAISQYTWDLAIGISSDLIIKAGVFKNKPRVVTNPYVNKWFADPFFLNINDDNIQLLVEEFDSEVNKGRIARIVIDKKRYLITECHIILELDTHLSFPAIYRINNKIYVHPENSASGKSTIYEYDQEQDKLVNPIVLIDAPLTDAIITKEGNYFLMYATMIPNAPGPTLYVFKSDELIGKYSKYNEIPVGARTARMAGAFIESSDGLIRPAQDCKHDYGEGVLFYKDGIVVSELRPRGLYEGLHTINTYNGYYVIDLKRYDYPRTHKFLKTIKSIFR